MGNETADLIRIAVTLHRALVELAETREGPSSSAETRETIERWTRRWIDLVEVILRDRQDGERNQELTVALCHLREALNALETQGGRVVA